MPQALAGLIAGLPLPPWAIMACIIALYFALGTFMEGFSMIITTVPVIFPVVVALGYDPIWFGVVAPAGTPKAIVDKYNATIKAMLARDDTQAKLLTMGLDSLTSTPEEFAAFIKSEVAKWAPVVKASGAKVE